MKTLFFSFCAVLCASLSNVSLASAQTAAPQAATSQANNLISNGDFAQDAECWTHRYLRTHNMPPTFVDANSITRITSEFRAESVDDENFKSSAMTINRPTDNALKASDTLISFWVRSPQSNALAALLGSVKPAPNTFFYKRVALTPEWKRYELEGATKTDFAADEVLIEFHWALAPDVIEITGVEIVNTTL